MLPAIAVRPAAVGTQEAFRLLFGNQLTETPKRFPTEATGRAKTLGWVFVSSDCRNMKACRTYQTLLAMSGQHTYYTRRILFTGMIDARKATLRYLNALVIDVDVKGADNPNAGLCLSDLLERISSAGLPCPTMIVRTPSGGYHVYFLLNAPRKAYTNVIQTYRRIQTAIAAAIGGDRRRLGPNVGSVCQLRKRLFMRPSNAYRSQSCWIGSVSTRTPYKRLNAALLSRRGYWTIRRENASSGRRSRETG
ncbi:hypothetical protein [Paenibacillus sp. Cedars]|uniref:hypothetical protein n=1 Tax=Paenibacillus sp. Cedars TaxID=1980674 RepID=UPI001164BE1C|nr:hypothetical protein [Paenibacillus sp. Cedars]AWP25339.1 hypothetical protein B9D94_01180 [Paenibacillus sp. Cedars]